jgi:hypothetical protein
MFLRHVHILFTRASLSSPAAGLRLEIARNIDKKKSELYFPLRLKKILTEKANRACPKQQRISNCIYQVTTSALAGVFFASTRC